MDTIIRRKPEHHPDHPQARLRTCAFSGCRLQKLPWRFDEYDPRCLDYKNRLKLEIESYINIGFTRFITGGAQGLEMWAAEEILELRNSYPWITLEIAVPYDTQSSKWEEALRNRYDMILENADQVTYISHDYTPGALFARNRYMIDQCDLLLAGSDGTGGGTDQLVQYAKRCRKTVRCIPTVIERAAVA